MRKLVIFIVFLIIIFIINIVFYSISDEYKFFLKKIKNTGDIVYLEEKGINDEIKLEEIENINIIKTSSDNEAIFDLEKENGKIELKSEIVLGNNYKKIIDLFEIYNLKKLELNSSLFDLTDEYPDNYFEYYSKDLTLYIFPTKRYNDLVDIFSILDDELPFSINEVNNFGDKSFYINLNKDIEDRFIRIVISNKGVAFGLKIKKTEYNLVKEKLNSLK